MKSSAEIVKEALESVSVAAKSPEWTAADILADPAKAAKAVEYLIKGEFVPSEKVDAYTKRTNVKSAESMLKVKKDAFKAASGDNSLEYAAFYEEIVTVASNYFVKYFIDLYNEFGEDAVEIVNECRKAEIKKAEEVAEQRRKNVAKARAKKANK